MALVPDGEIFSPTTLALWVKTLFSFNCLNLKQFKQYSRIQVRTNTTGAVRYLKDTQSIDQILMSCQCTEINLCNGKEKSEIFSPTHS